MLCLGEGDCCACSVAMETAARQSAPTKGSCQFSGATETRAIVRCQRLPLTRGALGCPDMHQAGEFLPPASHDY